VNTDPIQCPLCSGEGQVARAVDAGGAIALPPRVIECPLCSGAAFPVRPAIRESIKRALEAYFGLDYEGLKCPKCSAGIPDLRVRCNAEGAIVLNCDRCSWEAKGNPL
jgi:hypothetical protein